jgi:hypothetical protein
MNFRDKLEHLSLASLSSCSIKHFSLVPKLVKYGRKKLYKIGPSIHYVISKNDQQGCEMIEALAVY